MRQYLLLAVAIYALSGCIGTRRYAAHVTKAYNSFDTTAPTPITGVRFVYSGATTAQPLVHVTKGKTYFIPAIIYWGTKETFSCELNADACMRIIGKAYTGAATTYNLSNKLKGRTLEVNINAIPRRFTYTYQHDLIFLLLFYTQSSNQNIAPQTDDLALTYKLYEGADVIKEGRIEIRNYDYSHTDNLRSTKKITKAYIAQYRKNLEDMAAESFTKLVGEL